METSYLLECAWNDAGAASDRAFHPYTNIIGDVLSLEAFQGLGDVLRPSERCSPGQLRVTLRNTTGTYSPGGPLDGKLEGGHVLRLSGGYRKTSNAALFDSADTAYLALSDVVDVSVGDIYWDMVIWVKLPDPSAANPIISKWGAATHREYYLQTAGSKFKFYARYFDDSNAISVTANTFGALAADTWYMVHVYHDPTANVIGISVNGGVHDTAAIPAGIRDSDADFLVGTYGPGVYFTGSIGPLAIWKPTNTNLTAAQLTWLYNAGNGRHYSELGVSDTDGAYLSYDVNDVKALYAWWQTDEESGTRVDKILARGLVETSGTINHDNSGLATLTYWPLWNGRLSALKGKPDLSGAVTCDLEGTGDLAFFNRTLPLVYTLGANTTGNYIGVILLTIAGFPGMGGDRDTGQTTTSVVIQGDYSLFELLRQMEDVEGEGLITEGLSYAANGSRDLTLYSYLLNYYDRQHRSTATRSLIPQATFSDTAGLGIPFMDIELGESAVYNQAQVTIQPPPTAGSLAVLWTYSGASIPTGPNGYVKFTAVYPTAATGGATAVYVDPWTTPVPGTDVNVGYNYSGFQVEDVVKTANNMSFKVVNHYVRGTQTIYNAQARGIPWTKACESKVSAENTASITAYGSQSYPASPIWFANIDDAQAFCDYVVSRYKDPHKAITALTFAADRSEASMAQALTGRIGDRVTIDADDTSGLAIHEDFYIEHIYHSIRGKAQHMVTYELSSCAGDGSCLIVDTSELEYAAAHPDYPTSKIAY